MTNLLDGPPPVFHVDVHVDVDPIATCSGCGCALPPHAVYCVECGRCDLSQTDRGTRIVRSPYGPVPPMADPPDDAIPPPPDFGSGPFTAADSRDAVTHAVDPVPPKRSRPSGGYLIAPKAARSPDAVAGVVDTREANVRTLSRPARRWAPTGIARLDTDPRKDTVVARAPAAPAPYWDAPPKGNTVKRRAPEPGT